MSSEGSPAAHQLAKDFINMPSDNRLMGSYYDTIVPEIYEEMLKVVNCTEQDEIAKNVCELALESHIQILDVGAGTGLIGDRLFKSGYKNIDAVDASTNFLSALLQKGTYRKADHAFLGYGNFPKPEEEARYDVVTAAGMFLTGHLPKEGVEEIHRYLRPGGYFVTAMRAQYYQPEEECGYHGVF